MILNKITILPHQKNPPYIARISSAGWLVLIAIALLAEGSLVLAAEMSPVGQTAWNSRMRSLGVSLTSLFSDLLEDSVTSADGDSARQERIQKGALKLSEQAHQLRELDGLDPGMRIFAASLSSETAHGAAMWKEGHRAYARNVLLRSASLCMECHTRAPGPSVPATELGIQSADPLLKATTLAAIRDFDASLAEVRRGIGDEEFRRAHPFEWERFIRLGLQISVRARQSPNEGLVLVDQVLKLKDLPPIFREDVESWKSQLKSWSKENEFKEKTKKAATETEATAWKEVRQLAEGLSSRSKFAFDRGAEISALRLSSALHVFVQAYPGTKHLGEALELQGTAYELLRPTALWNAAESFWAACIHAAPHSEDASRCYRRLEDSVMAGWTGSSGMSIPKGVRERLMDLRQLSGPAPVQRDGKRMP